MSTTTCGAVTEGVWSTSYERISAFIRVAMNCCVAETIMRSVSASKYQLGRWRHSGSVTLVLMQGTAIGRCTANSTACCSEEAFGAKAEENASSGNQIRPSVSGASLGAFGCGPVL